MSPHIVYDIKTELDFQKGILIIQFALSDLAASPELR